MPNSPMLPRRLTMVTAPEKIAFSALTISQCIVAIGRPWLLDPSVYSVFAFSAASSMLPTI